MNIQFWKDGKKTKGSKVRKELAEQASAIVKDVALYDISAFLLKHAPEQSEDQIKDLAKSIEGLSQNDVIELFQEFGADVLQAFVDEFGSME